MSAIRKSTFLGHKLTYIIFAIIVAALGVFGDYCAVWLSLASGVPVPLILAISTAIIFLSLVFASSCVRCNSCGLNLFAFSISRYGALSWLAWLQETEVCPRCGYRCCAQSLNNKTESRKT